MNTIENKMMSRRWEQRDIKSYNRRNESWVHFPQAQEGIHLETETAA